MFIGTITGIVSATTRPPSSRARRDAAIWRSMRPGSPCVDDQQVPVQRSIRRAPTSPAAARARASLKPSLAPSKMPSSVVPGQRPVSSHSARISSRVGTARRHRVAVAVAVRCATRRSTTRARPGASASPSTARSCASSSARRARGVGLGAEHEAAQRGVSEHEPGVHAELAVERVEVLAEAVPRPRRRPARAPRAACPRPWRACGACSRRRRRAAVRARSCSCRRSRT